ncbi:hypothetical protein MACK_002965 [Theileria orientalis]|uniref:Calpain catalytic domain-containing protein n=1 Tax=Theileria orientalis TaxID=68886 RepID=A0A976QVV6_THEOR|nr:hypothetical protein MACK_002965 [Theileria orientalis]
MNKRKDNDPPPSSDFNIGTKYEEEPVEDEKMDVPVSPVSIKENAEAANSYVDDCFMPAWDHVIKYNHETVYESLNEVVNVENLWQDPNGMMELNTRQMKRFHCWIRYFDLCDKIHFFKEPPSADRIHQGYVGDCSTVSSLSSLSEYEKLNHKVLTDKIKLIDLKKTIKKLKKLSYPESWIRYLKNYNIAIGVKIYFNGCARCVFVDDWVPIRRDRSLLCAHSSDPEELWVTLLEKANVLLYGKTYSIRGTNPGIDIYHFTGWLPEIIQLPPYRYKLPLETFNGIKQNLNRCHGKDEITNMEKWNLIWNAIMHNFNRNIVVCVGTNQLYDAQAPDKDSEGVSVSSGIVSCHAYSVLDVIQLQLEGTVYKLLLLKNPWGKTSSKLPLDPKVIKMLPYYKDVCDEKTDKGVFWIEWINVLKWFSHLYLCWNRNKFEFTKTICFNWNRNAHFIDSLVPEDTYLSLHNPQMFITTRVDDQEDCSDGTVANDSDHFEHVDDDDKEGGRGDDFVIFVILIQNKKTMSDTMKYLGIHTFRADTPVVTPYSPAVNGVYNNSEVILMKLLVRRKYPNHEYNKLRYGKYNTIETGNKEVDLVMLVCNFMKKIENDNNFTIITFSNRQHKFKMFPLLTGMKIDNLNNFIYEFKWTECNSGTNPNEIWSFISNPHFRLEVKKDINIILMLETDATISVNLRLFFSRMATIRALKTKQAVSSGDYRLHCCVIKAHFKRGTYTLIPSNFDGTKARFRFSVFHGCGSDVIEIYAIPYPYIKLGDILKKNVPTCSEYTSDRVLCGSKDGENVPDKEYKIDASSFYRQENGNMVLDGDGLIDNTLMFYQIPGLFNVTVARMINEYFEFKVEKPTLVSIKIKINIADDSKFVLFAEHCEHYPFYSSTFCSASEVIGDCHSADGGNNRGDEKDGSINGECGNMDLDGAGSESRYGSRSLKFCDYVCCVICGGPYGRFYPTDPKLFPEEYKLGFDHTLFSDLNGGISRNGRSLSASAHLLFMRERMVNFTLVELYPNVQYRLKSISNQRFQTIFFISTSGTISA